MPANPEIDDARKASATARPCGNIGASAPMPRPISSPRRGRWTGWSRRWSMPTRVVLARAGC